MTSSAFTVALAGPEHTGTACSVCAEAIGAHQLLHLCDVCAAPAHQRCWEQSNGCGRPECAAKTSPVSPQAPASSLAPSPSVETEALPSQGGKIFLLLVAMTLTVLGPMIGIVVGFVWLAPQGHPVRRGDGRELLILCSVLFVIHVLMLTLVLSGMIALVQEGMFQTAGGLGSLP